MAKKTRTQRKRRPAKAPKAKAVSQGPQSKLSRWPVHAFLFPVFFLLVFYLDNIQEFALKAVLAPMAKTIGVAIGIWCLLTLVMRSGRKSAAVVSLASVGYFCFGHIRDALPQVEFALFGVGIDRGVLLACALLVVLILAGLAIAKSKWSWSVPTTLLNVLAISLVAVVGVQVIVRNVASMSAGSAANEMPTSEIAQPVSPTDSGQLPNIYHIVMDAYARNDVLKEWYGYDNQPFLDHLAAKGFFIANKAKANYAHTHLSLTSMMNMRHMSFPNKRAVEANMNVVRNMFYSNDVCRKLRGMGYSISYFSSGYSMTAKLEGAIHPYDEKLNAFERSVLMQGGDSEFDAHRRRVLYALDHLGDPNESDGPKYVLAHIVCPHPPFVFDASGNPRKVKARYQLSGGSHWYATGEGTVQDYRQQYLGQLRFANTKLKDTIDAILLQSKRPTIIILQGDHGPGSMLDWNSASRTNMPEKMSTLLAYYFSDARYDLLYDTITPVNTYRVIFRQYFGEDYRMLADTSFFSVSRGIFDFIDVTDTVDSWKPASE